MEFVYEFDNIGRQLDLLRDANRRLQDTNDGLRNIVDVNRDSLWGLNVARLPVNS